MDFSEARKELRKRFDAILDDRWYLAGRLLKAVDEYVTATPDPSWNAAHELLPAGWTMQLFDSGPPGPFNPGPDEDFHLPRFQLTAKLGILSSPPKHVWRGGTVAEAFAALAANPPTLEPD